jgi:hypothetical protein
VLDAANKIGNANTERVNDEGFIVVSWGSSPSLDAIADCVLGIVYQTLSASSYLRTMWIQNLLPKHAHPSSVTNGGDKLGSKDRHGDAEVEEEDRFIKRMRNGLVDPSKAIKFGDSSTTISTTPTVTLSPEDIERNRPKLLKMKEHLTSHKDVTIHALSIASVDIDVSGTKLIINSNVLPTTNAPVTAYCYIHWGTSRSTSHHAVVQCSNSKFRSHITELLKIM